MLIKTKKRLPKTDWAYERGVFKTPQGKYIARVLCPKRSYVTLSQHDTIDDAQKAYDSFYENLKK